MVFAWIFSGWPQIWQNPPIPPKIQEAQASQSTRSPTTNTGLAWTNPTRAYDDGGTGYANITAGNPSGSNVWGTYGFSLTGNTITQVRVSYDAWSAGFVNSQTVRPTGDDSNTCAATYSTGSSFFGVVDETSYSDADYYTMVTNGGGRLTMTTPAFSIPAGAIIQNVTVYLRGNNTGTASFRPSMKIGTTYYDTLGSTHDPSAYTTYSDAITTNPKTGVAWTVSDLNRSGGDSVNYLNAFGSAGTDNNPDNTISWAYMVANYTEYDDQIKVDVSWDGGSSWSSTQDTTLTSAEATTWYNVSAATTWTPAKLADGQLQVRALAQTVNNAEVVNLDWIPVEVTYTFPASITAPGSVQMPNYTLGGGGSTTRNFYDVSASVQVTADAGFTVNVYSSNLTGTNNNIAASNIKLVTDAVDTTDPTRIINCSGFLDIGEPASNEYALDTAKTIVTTSSGSGTCDIYPTIRVYISNNGTYVEQDSGTLTFTITTP